MPSNASEPSIGTVPAAETTPAAQSQVYPVTDSGPAENAYELVPDQRGLDLLELMLAGALPFNRFFDAEDASAVSGHGTLTDGARWSLAVTLEAPSDAILPTRATSPTLPTRATRAIVPTESSTPAAVPGPAGAGAGAFRLVLRDPEGVPLAVMPSARCWTDQVGGIHVAGAVQPMHEPTGRPFRRLRRPAAEIRAGLGGRPALGVAVATAPEPGSKLSVNPEATGRPVVLFALVGHGMRPAPSAGGLVRSLLDLLPGLPEGSAVVPLPLPAPTRPDGAESVLRTVVGAYGATLTEPVQWDPAPGSRPEPSAPNRASASSPVGIPARTPDRLPGGVVLFTGLSGSGKSTIAQALEDVLLERTDRTVTLLDGDLVRRHLSAGLGFSRADRDANVRRIGFVAAEVARHGGLAIAAPIAPYSSTREDVRRMVAAAGGTFLLVHVATDLAVCEARDRKGLYAKARAGEIPEFTGVSDPYEEPLDADLRLDTADRTVADCVEDVMALLVRSGLLPPD